MEVLYGNKNRQFTVPFYTDSSATLAIASNTRGTHCTRHIARHYLCCQQAVAVGDISLHHINGNAYQLADIGTKNIPAATAAYK
jgi:hypothetical protein